MSNSEKEETQAKEYKSQKVHITLDEDLVKDIEEIQDLTGVNQKTAVISLILKKMTPLFREWFQSNPLKQSNTINNNTYYSDSNMVSKPNLSMSNREDFSQYEELTVRSNDSADGIPDLPSNMPPLF